MPATYLVTTRCTLCGQCDVECPVGAITISSRGAWIDQEKCRGCGRCYANCASQAIDEFTNDETGGA